MSELSPNIQTIIDATRWLAASPDTHTGYRYGEVHVVEEMATTDDRSSPVPRGVYFGHTETYHQTGLLQTSGSVKLVNHADRASYHDYVPLTYGSRGDNQPFRRGSHDAIDVFQLQRFSEEQLARMAANARTVLAHYGVEMG